MSDHYWTGGGRQAEAPPASEPARVPAPPTPTATGRSPAQVLAAVFGATFLLVGLLGFVPGVTRDYGDLGLAGRESTAELLGLFQVSVVHNIVHMLFGVGLLAALRRSWSLAYLIGGGVLYLGVAGYGFVIDRSSEANFLPLNLADNWLHVALSAAMILFGLASARR